MYTVFEAWLHESALNSYQLVGYLALLIGVGVTNENPMGLMPNTLVTCILAQQFPAAPVGD